MASLYQERDTDQGLFAIQGLASAYSAERDCTVYIIRAKWNVANGRPVVRAVKEEQIPGDTLWGDVLLKYVNGRLVWARRNIH